MKISLISLGVLAALSSGHVLAGGRPSHAEHAGIAANPGAVHPMSWTSSPVLKTKISGENRQNMMTTIVPQNIVVERIDAYSNNLKDADAHRRLSLDMAGAKLDKPATAGFQMLTAREEQAGRIVVASTVYYFGERGAKNPTAMFMQQKNELEIIPQPFPREHSRYRANEDWKFLVRFNNRPLVNQKVRLETSNGSKADFVSDASGVLTVHIPDDFKAEENAKRAAHDHGKRKSGEWVLVAEYGAGGKSYLTAFNSSYGPDASDGRNLSLGLGFALLGMLGAAPLLRQRRKSPSKEEV